VNPNAPAVKRKAEEDWGEDMWTADGESIVDHIACVEDYQVAMATYRAAVERWPGGAITLRQGARVIEDSRRTTCSAVCGGQRATPLGRCHPDYRKPRHERNRARGRMLTSQVFGRGT
jgi:hypothetical protein